MSRGSDLAHHRRRDARGRARPRANGHRRDLSPGPRRQPARPGRPERHRSPLPRPLPQPPARGLPHGRRRAHRPDHRHPSGCLAALRRADPGDGGRAGSPHPARAADPGRAPDLGRDGARLQGAARVLAGGADDPLGGGPAGGARGRARPAPRHRGAAPQSTRGAARDRAAHLRASRHRGAAGRHRALGPAADRGDVRRAVLAGGRHAAPAGLVGYPGLDPGSPIQDRHRRGRRRAGHRPGRARQRLPELTRRDGRVHPVHGPAAGRAPHGGRPAPGRDDRGARAGRAAVHRGRSLHADRLRHAGRGRARARAALRRGHPQRGPVPGAPRGERRRQLDARRGPGPRSGAGAMPGAARGGRGRRHADRPRNRGAGLRARPRAVERVHHLAAHAPG